MCLRRGPQSTHSSARLLCCARLCSARLGPADSASCSSPTARVAQKLRKARRCAAPTGAAALAIPLAQTASRSPGRARRLECDYNAARLWARDRAALRRQRSNHISQLDRSARLCGGEQSLRRRSLGAARSLCALARRGPRLVGRAAGARRGSRRSQPASDDAGERGQLRATRHCTRDSQSRSAPC